MNQQPQKPQSKPPTSVTIKHRHEQTTKPNHPNNVIASSLHLLAEKQKNLKCAVDTERAKMSQRGKRQSRLDNDEPPPTKKRKGRPPANKTNSTNLGNGNSVHPNAAESKCCA